MEEITEYEVVTSTGLPELVEAVRDFIARGWEPIGGVSFDRYEYEPRPGKGTEIVREYIQAMIKRQGK